MPSAPVPAPDRLRARFAGILDAAPDCIITLDREGGITDYNAAAATTFGFRREQVLGREMAELIFPAPLRERHRADLRRWEATGEGGGMAGRRNEVTALRGDGTEFPVELTLTRIGEGAERFFAAYLRDVSDRHRADAAQRESRSYFEKSFHTSPALMSIASAVDGRLIEVNPAFARESGFTREEMLGRTTLELGLWEHREQREEFLRRIRDEGGLRDMEAVFRTRSGRMRTLLLNADLMELGGQPCMLTVAVDVTDRRRQERLQAATYQISQVILGGGDLAALFAEVHRIISGLMSARNLYVALLSPDGALLTFPYFVDETMEPPEPRPPRNGVTEFVLDTGEPLLALDTEVVAALKARGDYVPSGQPCAQWMGAPLRVDGRSLGVIALQDYHQAAAYTAEDLRLLVFVAEQTAVAIQRGKVEAAQREARTYFEKSFHSSPALMVISRLADRRITEANPAFLRACGYSREELIGHTADEINLWVRPEQRDEFFRRLRDHGAIRDLESEFRAKSGAITTFLVHADVLELGGAPSLLTVGIDITDRRRREKVQAATYAISQAVVAGGGLATLFPELHRIVGGLISAKNLYVALLSPDGALLSFPYFADEAASAPAPRQPGFGLTEYVLRTAKPLRTAGDGGASLRHEGHAYRPTGEPSAVWLGVPLVIEGRSIGVIAVQDYHNPDAYTDSDLQLLTFVADQAAAAVQRQQIEAGQRESRAYFEKSFHSNPALMSLSRADDGRFIEVNPAFTRRCGFGREEIIGRTIAELGLWRHDEQRRDYTERLAAQGCVRDQQAEFRHKDGRSYTLIINADTIELGGEPCVLTVAIDVTDRRRREQVQAATFQISRTVLAGGTLEGLFAELHRIVGGLMPAQNFYVALVSADGRELSFPYFVDEHVVAPPPRPLGNGFTECVLQGGRPLLVDAAELRALLQARGDYQPLDHPAAQRLGAPLIAAGRTLGVIALQDYVRADAYGEEELRVLNFVAEQVAVAVQRHQAEAALARAEQRYRSIFENAVEGLYVTSPEGRFLSANPALARMLGYGSPAALLAAINDITHQVYVQPGRRAEFFALIRESDQVVDFESEVYRRDGTTLWIAESVSVVRNAQGAVDHFEGVAADITVKREAARALQAAKEAADAASRAKSYFLASVSHELRTPLNGILGYTQILRRDPALTAKQRDGVRVIHESADHLLALINDVLDLSKIEAGRIELHPADFDLPDFAAGVAGVFAPRAREKSILFETALAPDLPRWVRGDEQRLRQVVFNLVANAVKFTRAGGVVFSVQRADDGAIRFSVSDTGPGIAEDDRKKLFEPFTQVGHEAGTAASGTGLGLAISRSLVERMGGELCVESEPGRGSRFWFEVVLPEAAAVPPAAATLSRRIVGYAGVRRRVLIVDDIAANRAVLVDMLAPIGFELAEAADGEAALREAERFQPDLVLMDLRLPGGIDGLEATRRLRRKEPGQALKIVAVSASAYDLDRSECFAAGCDAFLAKPFREEELWVIAEKALGLEWQYAELEETRTPFGEEVEPPPVVEAIAIYELAAKGDVVGLRRRAQALCKLDPKYAPFAQRVLDLATRFKMKAIRQFVARYTG